MHDGFLDLDLDDDEKREVARDFHFYNDEKREVAWDERSDASFQENAHSHHKIEFRLTKNSKQAKNNPNRMAKLVK